MKFRYTRFLFILLSTFGLFLCNKVLPFHYSSSFGAMWQHGRSASGSYVQSFKERCNNPLFKAGLAVAGITLCAYGAYKLFYSCSRNASPPFPTNRGKSDASPHISSAPQNLQSASPTSEADIKHNSSLQENSLSPIPLINYAFSCRENAEMQMAYAAIVSRRDIIAKLDGVERNPMFIRPLRRFWKDYKSYATIKDGIVLDIRKLEQATRDDVSLPGEKRLSKTGLTMNRCIRCVFDIPLFEVINLKEDEIDDSGNITETMQICIQDRLRTNKPATLFMFYPLGNKYLMKDIREQHQFNGTTYQLIGIMILLLPASESLHPQWSNHWLSYIKLENQWFRCNDHEITKLANYDAVKEFALQEGTIVTLAPLYAPLTRDFCSH